MHAALIVVLLCALIGAPGIGAALAAFGPGEIALVTRAAAVFGLGYAASGGAAFVLAAAGWLHPGSFLAVWAVVTAALWVVALRRSGVRAQARAVAGQAKEHALPLLLGAGVVVAILVVHLGYIDLLGGSRYVYYLNGIEIANSAGVPHATLEYGQSWPPATDKVFLDSFTGAVAMLAQNAAAGPGAMLWVSVGGSALALWATAWELGLQRIGSLLALLMVNNQYLLEPWVSRNFFEYRADDFGLAIAFCALALALHALRRRRWGATVLAGAMLGVATGTHAIPSVIAIAAFAIVVAVELIRPTISRPVPAPDEMPVADPAGETATAEKAVGVGAGFIPAPLAAPASRMAGPHEPEPFGKVGERAVAPEAEGAAVAGQPGGGDAGPPEAVAPGPAHRRPRPLRLVLLLHAIVVVAALGVVAVVIRLMGGGDLGLGGATNPASYRSIHTSFDPTAWLYTGARLAWDKHTGSHWYIRPSSAITSMMGTNGISWSIGAVLALLAVVIAVAIVMFVTQRDDLRVAGVTGAGLVAVVLLVALAFDYRYHIWIDATFGIRRLAVFISLGLFLVALTVAEALLAWLATARRALSALLSLAIVASLASWMLPGGIASAQARQTSAARVQVIDFLRTSTPCDSRFLVNQRTEGVLTALTGRYALMEGMGPFLRVDPLERVVNLALLLERYFHHPAERRGWLRREHITYVIYARRNFLLGYNAPFGSTHLTSLTSDRYLKQVYENSEFIVFKNLLADPAPTDSLLTGPYLHCERTTIHF